MNFKYIYILPVALTLVACQQKPTQESATIEKTDSKIKPVLVTQPVSNDTDDPAIWINPEDAGKSLIIGTDKGDEQGIGALYVYDLEGNILPEKTVKNIKRPNNVDIAYNVIIGNDTMDIAVCTERYTNSLRAFELPSMRPVDNGGIEVFVDEAQRAPMGIALYTNSESGQLYAIVGRKTGPDGSYLWQYLLEGDGRGNLKGKLVRKFGAFSGNKEIEAIAVDNELGYVYYSDETYGIRKYYAHPDSSNVELALFGNTGEFTQDHEGISIYKMEDGRGYILVSDQQANKFHIYSREGTKNNPHEHKLLKTIDVSTLESDGNDVTSVSLNDHFRHGLFVAMSDDKTFQFYRWEDIAGEDLIATNTEKVLKAQ